MMKKINFAIVLLVAGVLAACQDRDQIQPDSPVPTEQTGSAGTEGTAAKDSSQDNEADDTASKDGSESGSDENATSGQKAGPVKEQSYASEKEAVNAIEKYAVIDQTNVELGYGIKGFAEGAAGHQYISWNEGNWLIEVNFPSDPEYAIDGYGNAESLAKTVVAYLEEHFLPPPDQHGLIQINGFRQHPETLIQWQQGNKVYTIDQKTADPLEALQLAVDQTGKK
ncbi:hypothetical protein ACTHOQ_05695 [Solibacillus silvestris]|uniref:hypothetical protein n=1 Tax=Solibacillus silvestris TaxID=76853 RepID=UPI003F816BB6